MKVKNRPKKVCGGRSQNNHYFGSVLTWRGHKEVFWGAGNVAYLSLNGGHMGEYIFTEVIESYLHLGFVHRNACILNLN